jgi:hypothetical protein
MGFGCIRPRLEHRTVPTIIAYIHAHAFGLTQLVLDITSYFAL